MMSTRSTPPAYSHNSQTLQSSASTSTTPHTVDQTPSSSRPYNPSRSSQSHSHILPFPLNPRRPSRKASQATIQSFSQFGPSTPRKRVNGNDEKGDWANMDADEVFRRLPVGEVRKVESKMRTEALGKQSELRSMVGTRYRDLLTSATQITSLRSSSLRLSDNLKSVAQACSSTSGIAITAGEEEEEEEMGDDAVTLLPVAAHMKLLLDAPEALYGYLARHAFLEAAFLWLVARVVKEGLSGMTEELNSPYLPLLQKQWETLVPFRAQIVHRATAALRSRDEMQAKTLAETLLAIILLDNLPVPEALSLLLNQRTKALRDILAHPPSSSASQTSPSKARQRSTSHSQAPQNTISSTLSEAVQSLLSTVSSVQTVFAKPKSTSNPESLLEEMIRLIQVGETPASLPPQITVRRTSHQRRASRLASISLPFVPSKSKSATSPIPTSTTQILQNLPSSQLLLRNLPPTILNFTPFITPSPPCEIETKLKTWEEGVVGILRDDVPGWVGGLGSVKGVWEVRGVVGSMLGEGQDGFEREVGMVLGEIWEKRVEGVWKGRLEGWVRGLEEKIKRGSSAVLEKGNEMDVHPESFMFSDLPFPQPPTSSFSAPPNLFDDFLETLTKRTKRRTPLLDGVLVGLEEGARELKFDMQVEGLPERLFVEYGKGVEEMLKGLLRVLEKSLADAGKEKGVEGEMFVGRVAIYLAKESGFLNDLVGKGDVDTGPVTQSLLEIHSRSTDRWRAQTISESIMPLPPIFDPLITSYEVRASWQGSLHPAGPLPGVMIALHSLVQATRTLGIPPGVEVDVVKGLVEGFVERVKGMEGWIDLDGERAMQGCFDLGFLGLLCGSKVEDDVVISKMLTKIASDDQASFKESLPNLINEHLRRVQIILSPLLRHLTPPPSNEIISRNSTNSLLRFGVPAMAKFGGGSAEFKSPVAVARPGKRFGLLSIGS